MKRFKADIIQGGLKVVSIDCPTYEDAQKEIGHYVMMYSQDGIIDVRRNFKVFKSSISLCPFCYCMTKTLRRNRCGKCKRDKGDEHDDKNN